MLRVRTPRITLAPYDSEAVTLRGGIKVAPSGAGSAIKGMTLNGVGRTTELGPSIHANSVILRNNDITNEHTGICVQVSRFYSRPAPRGVVIRGNRIHDCGRLPATNYDHGIYLSEARRTVIRGNWIYDNADRGVQLYPNAQRTTIVGNVIDGNGQGVIFAGKGGNVSSHNLLERNVIANSEIRWNVESWTGGQTATGNVVRRNCVFASNSEPYYNSDGGIQTPSEDYKARGNRVADPEYVNASADDFRVAPESGCAGLLGSR